MTTKAPLSDWVERGGTALAGGGWAEARSCFEQALGCTAGGGVRFEDEYRYLIAGS